MCTTIVIEFVPRMTKGLLIVSSAAGVVITLSIFSKVFGNEVRFRKADFWERIALIPNDFTKKSISYDRPS